MTTNVSLRDKIGQMLIMGFDGTQFDNRSEIAKSIHQDNLGGVILFDYNFQKNIFDKNIKNPQQVSELNQALQNYAQQKQLEINGIKLPLLIGVDYEGGKVNRLHDKYGFPKTISPQQLTESSPDHIDTILTLMAATLQNSSFNLNFAPSLDVNLNPENPIIGKLQRSFSKSSHQVFDMAIRFAQAMFEKQILCCYKHFPGHGSAQADSHKGFVDVSDCWQGDELIPFQKIAANSQPHTMIMTGHLVNRKLCQQSLPATLSQGVITGLLRDKFYFQGVIVSDDMQMKAITDIFGIKYSLILAINAGVNMFIFGNQLSDKPAKSSDIIDIIETAISQNEISINTINDSYQRVVKLKQYFMGRNEKQL